MATKRKGVTHRVDIGGTSGAMASRTTGSGTTFRDIPNTRIDPLEALGHTEHVMGLEHKPKLSEAVMHAVGIHRGYVPDEDPDDAEDETIAANARRRALADATDENLSDDDEVIVDNRDIPGAIFREAPASPKECVELYDVQNYLAAKYGGYIERTKRKKKTAKGKPVDRVTIRMTYGDDAEVVTGVGANNPEALRALCDKLGETGFAVFATDETEAD